MGALPCLARARREAAKPKLWSLRSIQLDHVSDSPATASPKIEMLSSTSALPDPCPTFTASQDDYIDDGYEDEYEDAFADESSPAGKARVREG